MCSTRFSAVAMVEPGPPVIGSLSAGLKRAPAPVVRLMTTSVAESRMRSTTSR